MKKVLNFVKGKRDDKKDSKVVNSHISVEITNPSGHKVPSEDEHLSGLQSGYGYDVDLNGKDRSMTKIHKAAWQGNLDKLKIHVKKFDVNLTDEFNRTPLHFACAHGHTNVVSYLLNNKAVADIYDSDGMTPLLKAVECGVKDCVNILIEKGVDVNVADTNGNTSLHLAAKHGFFNIMSTLLKNGANYDCSNNIGEMPLHIATDQEHGELVELLLQFGAHVNVVDRDNRTPLMLAARNGINTLVTLFLGHGAHLDACDSNGWTAEDYALIGGHEQLAAELKVPVTELHIDEARTIQNNSVNTVAPPHKTDNEDENIENMNVEEENYAAQAIQKTKEGIKSPPNSILIIEEDSPRSCVTPPPLKPPRSWEMIQAGMIDQTQVQRRSLMTLGTLRSRRESFNDASGGTSPHSGQADNTHMQIEEAVKIASGDCKVKASSDTEWDSEDSLPADCVLPSNLLLPVTPDRRSRITLERTPSIDLTDDEHSENKVLLSEDVLCREEDAWDTKHTQLGNNTDINTGENNNNININIRQCNENINNNIIIYDTGQKNSVTSEDCSENVSNEVYKSIVETKGRLDKELKCSSIGIIEGKKVRESCSLDNLDDIKKTHIEITDFHSCSDLDKESLNTTENLYSGAFSLDTLDAETSTNDRELAQSLDSLDESPLGTVVKKNIFRESHSLDVLEDLGSGCIGSRPVRKHVRNKSICMNSQCWSKSVDVLSRPCNASKVCIDKKNIDAQLECYDEALRELAEAEKLKQNTSCRTSDKTNISISRQETYTITIESEINTKDMNSFVESGQNISEKKVDLPKQNHKIQNSVINSDMNRIEKDVDSNNTLLLSDLQINSKTIQELQSTSACIDVITPDEKETIENPCSQLKIKTLQDGNTKADSELHSEPKHEILYTKKNNDNIVNSNYQNNECIDKINENFIAKEHNGTENLENSDSLTFTKKTINKEKCDVNSEAEDNTKEKKFCKPVAVYIEQIISNKDDTTKSKRNKQEVVLSEKSESDSDWHQRPIRNKRRQLLAMRDVVANSKDSDDSIEEDPPFWMSTDKGGCFARQDTVVFQPPNISTPTNTPQPKFSGKPVVSDLNLKTKTSTEGEGEESSASSEPDSGSLSQSDATPQHTYTLRNHQSLLKEHLRQATSEKARLEELAAQLKDQNGRLQYELADIIQIVAVRDDTIRILQEQLARLETKHSITLDEVHNLKHKLNTSEVELRHLRDLVTKSNLERDRKNADMDKSYQEILKHLEEVIQANKQVKAEKEALIGQNIKDIKKLQEDTLHWKDLYEEAVSKLEQIQGTCEPHLMKTMRKVDALQVTIKKLQDEKLLENERWHSRLTVEEQLKQEFENTRQKLLLELTKVQTALKDKEAEEKLLREHCEKLTQEIEKSEELKRRQLLEKSYNLNLADQITMKEKELSVKQSVISPSTSLSSPPTPPPPPSPPPPPPLPPPLMPMASLMFCKPTEDNLFSPKTLQQQLENSITRQKGDQSLGKDIVNLKTPFKTSDCVADRNKQ